MVVCTIRVSLPQSPKQQIALPNALIQLLAQYDHCGEAASEKCLAAATFVRPGGEDAVDSLVVVAVTWLQLLRFYVHSEG